jgi:hypothetical protein
MNVFTKEPINYKIQSSPNNKNTKGYIFVHDDKKIIPIIKINRCTVSSHVQSTNNNYSKIKLYLHFGSIISKLNIFIDEINKNYELKIPKLDGYHLNCVHSTKYNDKFKKFKKGTDVLCKLQISYIRSLKSGLKLRILVDDIKLAKSGFDEYYKYSFRTKDITKVSIKPKSLQPTIIEI